MKRLGAFFSLVLLFQSAAFGATWFVRKTGNDTTGDGSTGLPWLTISKAQASASSGDTINIGDGTYNESTAAAGTFSINRAFTSTTTFQSENAVPENVIITGQGSNTLNTFTSAANSGYHFKDVTFAAFVATNTSTVRITQTSSMTFTNCRFLAPVNGAASHYALQITQSGATNISSVTTNNCMFTSTQAIGFGIGVNQGAGGNTSGVTFINSISSAPIPLDLSGSVTSFAVIGGVFNSNGTYGIKVGQDSNVPLGPLTGFIRDATVSTARGTGHGIMIGAGASSITVTGCDITGADYGLVNKENFGNFIANNVLRGGAVSVVNGSALYFKGSTGTAVNNILVSTATNASGTLRVNAGDTGNKCGSIVFKNNRLVSTDVKAINWGNSTHDSGGSIVDNNIFQLIGSATYGDVYGTTGITTLAGLKAAWSTYSVPTNDQNSLSAATIPLINNLTRGLRRNR